MAKSTKLTPYRSHILRTKVTCHSTLTTQAMVILSKATTTRGTTNKSTEFILHREVIRLTILKVPTSIKVTELTKDSEASHQAEEGLTIRVDTTARDTTTKTLIVSITTRAIKIMMKMGMRFKIMTMRTTESRRCQ